jgi:hypothetical protein
VCPFVTLSNPVGASVADCMNATGIHVKTPTDRATADNLTDRIALSPRTWSTSDICHRGPE